MTSCNRVKSVQLMHGCVLQQVLVLTWNLVTSSCGSELELQAQQPSLLYSEEQGADCQTKTVDAPVA